MLELPSVNVPGRQYRPPADRPDKIGADAITAAAFGRSGGWGGRIHAISDCHGFTPISANTARRIAGGNAGHAATTSATAESAGSVPETVPRSGVTPCFSAIFVIGSFPVPPIHIRAMPNASFSAISRGEQRTGARK